MIVTKEQAEKLWCPMVRESGIAGEDAGAYNMWQTAKEGRKNIKCIADECMMWVWSGEEYIDEQGCINKGSCGLIL